MEITAKAQPVFKRHIALPTDHGSWVFLLSPLIIGLFAGGRLTSASLFLILAAMAAFLIRQPLTIMVKSLSGRRSARDLPVARFWAMVYAAIGLAALLGLVILGFGWLLILALPGAPVFAWHLYLVSKRQERRQMVIEMVGSGVLALAAPAAYWVGIGQPDTFGWWLFALCWTQSAASIVYAYQRLAQRALPGIPALATRIRMGAPALLYTALNLGIVAVLALRGILPSLLPLPFALQFAETVWGSLIRPAVGFKPTTIGIRQLIVSSVFTLLFILAIMISE